MHRNTDQTPQASFPGDQGGHGVFHAAITALDDGVLRIGVGANQFIEKCHCLGGILWQCSPILVVFCIGLVIEIERYIAQVLSAVQIVRVSRPREVNHIFGYKIPISTGASRCDVLLQSAGSSNGVSGGCMNGYIEITPNSMILTADVWLCMPPVVIIFTDLGIPLCHGVFDAFLIHPTASTDLTRNLSRPCHLKCGAFSGANRCIELHF